MHILKKLTLYTVATFSIAYTISWHTYTFTAIPTPTIIKECPNSWDDSVYFNTEIIRNYKAINNQLQSDGFQVKFFNTSDNFKINSLYLERPDAAYTIILCAGFSPGKKEGMAPFFKLLPDNCNILFFDARGHGESDGSFFKSILSYGTSEYKDIIGAIAFVNSQNNKPIILLGTCAGAFHSAHAILELEKENKLKSMRVAGLIFDSGWGSATNVAATVPQAEIQEMYLSLLKKIYSSKPIYKSGTSVSKNTLRNSIPFKIGAPILNICTLLFYKIVYQWPFVWHERSTNLFDRIKKVPLPIFFVHSHDDNYAPIEEVKRLAATTSCKTCWWIEQPSKHACHSLKHKKEYKKKLEKYLHNTLKINSSANQSIKDE